ncbi:peptidase M11 [Colwellia sp. 12G3]|nr:peptidase M11 [Colwellia sp. 12G3]
MVLTGVIVLLLAFIGYKAWQEYLIYEINKTTESFPTAAGPATEDPRQRAQNQTLALAKLMANYRRADKSNKAKFLTQVLALAKERQALLAELIQTDPAAAVRTILPASVRKGMPDEVLAMLTEKQALKGELEVFYEDYEDPSLSRLHHVLKTENGRVELNLPKNAKANALQSGAKVQVHGWLFKHGGETIDSLAVSDEQDGLLVLALDSSTTTTSTTSTASTTQATLPNTLGEQHTLVLLVNFQDNANEQPWTVAQVQDMVFGTVNGFYQENSYGQTWLSGDVEGYLTLPINATCDFGTIDDYAQQAATDNGIDVSSYMRLVYLFPKNNDCGWRGQGTVGGTPSRAWINGEFNLLTIGHELGHNFGLHHAKDLDCGADIIGDNCASAAYGDNLDIMGKSTGHSNAFNKEQLGWLTSDLGSIVIADVDGSYMLSAYETTFDGVAKGLKVRRGTDTTTGQPVWYYIEYRQALGFDSFLEGKTGITDGVVLHLATEKDIQSNLLLDMIPNSGLSDLDKAALLLGVSYNDIEAGVTITTEWADSNGVSVNVIYSAQSCVKGNPNLSLSPNESAWVAPGTTLAYSATVTNLDSAACASSDFSVAASLPAGWVASSNSLNLAPSASGAVPIDVTSASTAVDGFYDITINAQNSSDNNYNTSAVVSYVVATPAPVCVVANPLLSLINSQGGEVTAGSTVTYTATVTNQNNESCAVADFNIVANVPTGWGASASNVVLTSGSSATVNLNVTSATSASDGAYDFSINAQDSANTSYSSSAVASYHVTTPPPVCVAANPIISLSGLGGTVIAGSTVNYSATVTNLDSAECTAANVAVFADVPAGWSASTPSVNLTPGASTTVTLSVTSNSNATDGSYNITIHAENSADSRYSNTDIVSYEISTPVKINTAPVAVNDSVIMTSKEVIIIPVLANDWDAENDSLTISTVTQGAKGSVQITADGQLLYTPAKSFKSSDSFSYTISDGEKTASATVTLSLKSTGGGKGKGKG